MGGTSTDVSHHAGAFERVAETEVAGVRVRAPMMSLHSIAAGGGSIVRFDGMRLCVGPQSAGADPGPASYGRGGPLTVTDANVVLGRIQPEFFPAVFGADGARPLDAEIARRGFADLAEAMSPPGRVLTREEAAAGALLIAVNAMAGAVKRISVARGHDLAGYTLQCFGGAGGQHACQVADALGMSRILIHPLAGVLSAYGMGVADQIAIREGPVGLPLGAPAVGVAGDLALRLAAEATRELERQGVTVAAVRTARTLLVRYEGTDTALPCVLGETHDPAAIRGQFEQAYRRQFAFLMPERDLVIESVSVECAAAGASVVAPAAAAAAGEPEAGPQVHDPPAAAHVPLFCRAAAAEGSSAAAGWCPAPLFRREALRAGARIAGPAIVAERNATTVIDPGWQATVDAGGSLQLERTTAREAFRGAGTQSDPILLEVFNHLFMNVAEQMGVLLQQTASSVNIKERLDFSCAVFDAAGRLIANAPHMPVHLGSMSESIRAVIGRNPAMRRGDVYALNDPYHGGTHLPDITVVTPVFPDPPRAGETAPAFFVASRGHHADVGGSTPGSMPPFSTAIGEEGVLIDNFHLVAQGVLREAPLFALLESGACPARNPARNLADLRAQIAANEQGARELLGLCDHYGRPMVEAYMRHVQDHAEECVRRAITALHDGRFALSLDNGAVIRVALGIDAAARAATVDFTGTSPQMANNFNAPRAITMAAVLYVFRTLVDEGIPLNAGCLKALEVIVPDGSLLNPRPPAAVVAGNVETSMCVTNALYGALGVMAASQCTMNNFTFGNAAHQYYETIAGGSGAGRGFDGTAAVQTHMTNSRLTDPEVLELRHPVRVESHEIRCGTGGAGRWRGGDGALRRIRFLEPMSASILSNGRSTGAFGMDGGGAGAPGANWVERADGRIEPLGAIAQVEMRRIRKTIGAFPRRFHPADRQPRPGRCPQCAPPARQRSFSSSRFASAIASGSSSSA